MPLRSSVIFDEKKQKEQSVELPVVTDLLVSKKGGKQQKRTPDRSTSNTLYPVPHNIINLPVGKQTQKTLKKEKIMETKLSKLIAENNKVLFRTKTVFPFDLFPDFIEIDPLQVHVTLNEFFKSKRVHSINIKDIDDVFVEAAGFFGTLKLIDRDFTENEITVPFLKYNDAIKAKKIIQGLIVGEKEGIDFSQIEDKNLVQKVEQLGAPAQ